MCKWKISSEMFICDQSVSTFKNYKLCKLSYKQNSLWEWADYFLSLTNLFSGTLKYSFQPRTFRFIYPSFEMFWEEISNDFSMTSTLFFRFSTDILSCYCVPRYLVSSGAFWISHALLQSAPAERITYLGTQALLDKQPIMNRDRLTLFDFYIYFLHLKVEILILAIY